MPTLSVIFSLPITHVFSQNPFHQPYFQMDRAVSSLHGSRQSLAENVSRCILRSQQQQIWLTLKTPNYQKLLQDRTVLYFRWYMSSYMNTSHYLLWQWSNLGATLWTVYNHSEQEHRSPFGMHSQSPLCCTFSGRQAPITTSQKSGERRKHSLGPPKGFPAFSILGIILLMLANFILSDATKSPACLKNWAYFTTGRGTCSISRAIHTTRAHARNELKWKHGRRSH